MYTCNTCSLQFPTPEDQRAHMKSEWHRYNLKRRVASLPAIDEDLFNEKVSKLSVNEEEDESKTKKKEKQLTKKEQRRKEKEELLEKKKQLLEIAKQNMLNSLKTDGKISIDKEEPKEEVEESKEDIKGADIPENIRDEIVEEQAEAKTTEIPEEEMTEEQLLAKIMEEKLKNRVEIPPEVCLFCTKKYPTFEVCTTHMFKQHGFYIPEQKYLTDKLGLVGYMAEKIGVGNLCIVCDYQGRSIEAVRAHMLAKQHCRIPFESENEKLEISEFYDFSSTYDYLNEDKGEGEGEVEGEWEDLEDGEEVVDASDSDSDNEESRGQDEELPQQILYDDGVELHLPSGVKIGHRSLAKYYRQNLRPESVLSEGQGTVIAAESRHLVSIADRALLMEKKRTWRTEKTHQDRDDRRAAKFINNQPHYRDQLLQ